MGVFHGDPKSFDPQKVHYEVCLPISGKIKGEREVKGKDLEKGAFACITHSGSLQKLPDTYREILKWIEDNRYQTAGSTREIYHKGIGEAGGSLLEYLIEVQIPVRK
jgi:AraC family transcriptional regulator